MKLINLKTLSKKKIIFIICFIQLFIWVLGYYSVVNQQEAVLKWFNSLYSNHSSKYTIAIFYLLINITEAILFTTILYGSLNIPNYLGTKNGKFIFNFFILFSIIRIFIYLPLTLYFSGILDYLTNALPIIYRTILNKCISLISPIVLSIVSSLLYDLLKFLFMKQKKIPSKYKNPAEY